MKLVRAFCAIQRIDMENRTIEGYAFVNERCGDGICIPRALMEKASPDYMKWANVREMHGSNGAGVVETLDWDATGAFIRVKVVDDQVWEKVKAKVYKAFSIGIRILKMKDDVVTDGKWVETSIVDRPADEGALITSIGRAEGEDPDAEFEVEVETTEEPKDDPTSEEEENSERLAAAVKRAETAETSLSESAANITRLESEKAKLLIRAEAAEAEVKRMKEEEPDPKKDKPMKITAAGLVQRMGEKQEIDEETRKANAARLAELSKTDFTNATESERRAALLEFQELRAAQG